MTAADLEALPVGTIVYDRSGRGWYQRGKQSGRWWSTASETVDSAEALLLSVGNVTLKRPR